MEARRAELVAPRGTSYDALLPAAVLPRCRVRPATVIGCAVVFLHLDPLLGRQHSLDLLVVLGHQCTGFAGEPLDRGCLLGGQPQGRRHLRVVAGG